MSSMIRAITTATTNTAPTTANPSSSPTTGSATGSSTSTATNDGLGRDAFLKLLVAQLRFQDPMKPADGTAFLTQTAQFSMVEKLSDILTASTEAATNSATFTATGMVGRTITYTGDLGLAVKGTVASVRLERTGPVLVVDGKDVPLANVRSVLQSSSTPAAVVTEPLPTAVPPNTTIPISTVSTGKGNQ